MKKLSIPPELIIMDDKLEQRKAQILKWLSEGKTVVFKVKNTNIIKTLIEWNEDKNGELIADTWTGKWRGISWRSDNYSISWEY